MYTAAVTSTNAFWLAISKDGPAAQLVSDQPQENFYPVSKSFILLDKVRTVLQRIDINKSNR
jgi:hypothetical protein